jgi:dinuclear metal center YbgI/SA1388 family protein
MQLNQIIEVLENFAPLQYQEAYDNSGLLVGNKAAIINKALLTLDCTEAIVDEAIAIGANLIIAHHPIIFNGLKQLTGNNYVEQTIIKAIKNDIAIYACHTNLDNIINGVNAKISQKLGLQDLRILLPKYKTLKKLITYVPQPQAELVRTALFNAGAGQQGNYSHCSFNSDGIGTFMPNEFATPATGQSNKLTQHIETKVEVVFDSHLENNILKTLFASHPYEEVAYDIVEIQNLNKQIGSGLIGKLPKTTDTIELLTKIKTVFGINTIKHTKIVHQNIDTIALCGGSGSFLLKNAIQQEAQLFISADFKYHEYFNAENKIIIADIGHFESEQFTVEIFYSLLQEKFATFALQKSTLNTNPVNYL